jgi:hypothetical protein
MDEVQAQAQKEALQRWLASKGKKLAGPLLQLERLLGRPRISPDDLTPVLRGAGLGGYAQELADVLNLAGAAPSAEPPTAVGGAEAAPASVAEPTTAAAPASDGVIVDHTRPDELQEVLDGFSIMDYSGPAAEPVGLRWRTSKAGVEFRWKDNAPGQFRVFRLVSSDSDVPSRPEDGDTIAVTTGNSFTDPRPMTAAIRHYQLWVNSGSDLESAQWEQPALVGEGSVVAPPQDIILRVEPLGGADGERSQVIGQWSLLPGGRAVQIYRVPLAQAASAGLANSAFRINAGDTATGGFVDAETTVGEYRYQFVVEAEVAGVTQLSSALLRSVVVPARRRLIGDLTCEESSDADGSTFTLTWAAASSGRTVIYRTQEQPLSGTVGQEHPLQALPHLGLPEDLILVHPISQDGGTSRMLNVALPEGWPRAYFTPVHVVDGHARIGRTVLRVQTRPVTDVQIHQRLSRQIITFGWPTAASGDPDGSQASVVSVFESAKGTSAKAATSGTPIATASKEVYDTEGGIVLTRPLRPEGSVVHLVPYAFAGQHPVAGPAAAAEYPGLLCIRYQVKSSWKLGLRRRRRLELSVTADRDVSGSPRFALIHNPERLPLTPQDGTPLEVWPVGDETAEPSASFKPSSLTVEPSGEEWYCLVERPGFVRLFALQLKPQQLASVAVLDPPIRDLQCLL